jgi:two-component system LytT family response regulator
MRVLIADDEPLAREGIRLRLEQHADIDIVGTAGDGPDAIGAIRRLTPDVVFLDVQMPGMSGFDVLSRAGVDSVPVVIFVTAHEQYAIRAFRAHALDYLLKPVDDDQFADTLQRARRRLGALRDGETARRLRALLNDVSPPVTRSRYVERLMIKRRGRISFVAADEIEWIEARGDYVRIHAARRAWVVRGTLRELERRLDPDRFLRVHRSTMVGLRSIREVRPLSHGECAVLTASGTELRVSRTRRAALARAVGRAS